MLQIRGVSKSFGTQKVLQPMDLSLPKGKTTVILGPSGCGKSTLLRLIIGLTEPDEGSVLIDDQELTSENVADMRKRMGYVIQEGGLFPHLTARSNVLLMARQLRWPVKDQEARLDELVELTHFPKDGLDRYPIQLSGGQRQRVGLMRALMLDPDCLLLDEPLGALDPMIRAQLQQDLRDIFQRLKTTVILVTHDIGEAAYLGDEVLLMRSGRLIQRGTWQQLVDEPADPFVTEFLNAQRSPLQAENIP